MKKVYHLNCGISIPSVGLGCGAIKKEEMETTLRIALSEGYRLFDCALLYGNEAWVGEALENIFMEGEYSRKDIFITSKLPMIGNHPDRVEIFLKKTLKNLRTSYVDLYLIHFPVGFQYEDEETYFPKKDGQILLDFQQDDILPVWEAMEKQVLQGRVKAIGVSNFSVDQLERILATCEIPPANLQVEVHAYFQQKELRVFCEDNGIVVSAYAPLGSPGRREAFKPNGVPELMTDPMVETIAKRHGKATSQILLRFLIDEKIVVLPKSVSQKRLRDNIQLFDFDLTVDDIENLRDLDAGERGRSFDYLKIFPGLEKHPENPMPLPAEE